MFNNISDICDIFSDSVKNIMKTTASETLWTVERLWSI